ncbi:MAG: IclR family transcriptional regulator [Desulfococcaceae bacterium]
MPAAGEKYYFISSLAKGIRVLELLAEQEALTVTEVADRLGTNRAGSHRFLATLRELGYVEKVDASRYGLTFKLLEEGMKFAGRFEIRRIARSYMLELSSAFRETVNLGYWDGKTIIHLDKIDSREILRMDSGIGTQAPAYCTGLGKAVLAFLPREELEAYLKTIDLEPLGPKTLTDIDSLCKELEITRDRGYALDDEEFRSGLRCVASPVFDYTGRPAYSMSVAGPAARITGEKIDMIQELLRAVCSRLSEHLGRPH